MFIFVRPFPAYSILTSKRGGITQLFLCKKQMHFYSYCQCRPFLGIFFCKYLFSCKVSVLVIIITFLLEETFFLKIYFSGRYVWDRTNFIKRQKKVPGAKKNCLFTQSFYHNINWSLNHPITLSHDHPIMKWYICLQVLKMLLIF